MINSIKETLVRHKRIIPVLVAIVAIAAYMIPAHLASAAVIGSGNVHSAITQSNSVSAFNSGKYGGAFANDNTLTNAAANVATVQISNHGGGLYVGGHYVGKSNGVVGSGNVDQAISQSNSVTATNTADFGIATADHNTLTNDAANIADVHISNHGGHKHSGGSSGVVGSGNVNQAIDQSNSVSATNSGFAGIATADHNTLTNTAANIADVHISNHGGHKHSGGSSGVVGSGNVDQAISQSNSVSASNSGDNGAASASDNSLSNTAINSATVHISNSNSNHHNDKKH
jgi:hypothetical protein